MRRMFGHWQKKQKVWSNFRKRTASGGEARQQKSQSQFHLWLGPSWWLWTVYTTSVTFTTDTTNSTGLCMPPVMAAVLALLKCESNPGRTFAADNTGPCMSPLVRPPLMFGTLDSGGWSGLARGWLSPTLRPSSSFHILLFLSFSGAGPRPESTVLDKTKYWSSQGWPPEG